MMIIMVMIMIMIMMIIIIMMIMMIMMIPTRLLLQATPFFTVESNLMMAMMMVMMMMMMTTVMMMMMTVMMTMTKITMTMETLEDGAGVGRGGEVVGNSAREPFTSYLLKYLHYLVLHLNLDYLEHEMILMRIWVRV